MTFVHLHNHSTYSLLDGAAKVDAMVNRAKELGMPAIGLSDHGTLGGAYSFYHACKSAGIKPIIGIEFYCAPHSLTDKTPTFWGRPDQRREDVSGAGKYTHLSVYARNAEGLRNLYRLHHRASSEGFYGKPRIDLDSLAECRNGLLVLSGCAGSHLSTRIRLGQFDEARVLAEAMQEAFGDYYYIEVMNHGLDFEDQLNTGLYAVADELAIPTVATNDCHYVEDCDAAVHDALLCVQTQARLSDENRFRFDGHGYYLRSRAEMDLLPLRRESLDATLAIAGLVEDYDDVFERKVRFPVPTYIRDKSLEDELYERSGAGLIEIVREKPVDEQWDYAERNTDELETICGLGYAGYFLTLQELMDDARREFNASFGPSRGSGGGSLVAYSLGITGLDPLEHGLLFERFLNPERVSLPDIDVDISERQRPEFIELVREKFGDDRVAVIGTYGTIGARAAIHDAGRVLGYSRTVTNEITGLLPPALFGRSPGLDDLVVPKDYYPDIIELARGLEGLIRNASQHASGVVICPDPLIDLVPLWRAGGKGANVMSYSMNEVEQLGLVKFDFLGLRTLGVIDATLSMLHTL